MRAKTQKALSQPKTAKIAKAAIAALFCSVAVSLFFIDFSPAKFDLKAGQIAQENIIATRRIVDARTTRYLQDMAENYTAPVFDYMNSAGEKASSSVRKFFASLKAMYAEYISQVAIDTVNNVYGTALTLENIEYYYNASAQDKEMLENDILSVIADAYRGEIRASELETIKASLIEPIEKRWPDPNAFAIASNLIHSFVQPNMMLNERLTQQKRNTAREGVYEVVYEAGQTIINRGEAVTQNQIALLADNGLLKRTGIFSDPMRDLACALVILLLCCLFIYSLALFFPEAYRGLSDFALLISLFTAALAIAKVTFYFSVYLVPTSFLAMAFCVFFSHRAAITANVFYMLLLSIILPLDIDAAMYCFIGALAAIASLKKIKSRDSILWAGIVVLAANLASIGLLSLIRKYSFDQMLDNASYAIGNGAFSALLTIAVTMVIESVFNVATPFRLLEMAAPGDPALLSLITNAQGTYHHSLIVSNLAEAACKDIGANALLARVGAYYHDLGKLNNSIFFRENQDTLPNPHDRIAPETSAQIIKGHVSSGLEYAAKFRLPKEVTEFIRTHHGTSEISFFKNLAEKQHYNGSETFRYEYSLPRTKEQSVVMLADSVEAAVRSLDLHTHETIQHMIDLIVYKKIHEGQMDDSELSFQDLTKMKASFLSVLIGVYHTRLQYPLPESDENEENPGEDPSQDKAGA